MSLDYDTFEKTLKSFFDNSHLPERNFVIMTGSGGMNAINDAIGVEAAMVFLKSLYKRKLVNLPEYATLKKMIHSPDRENLTVARSIMELKSLPDEQR